MKFLLASFLFLFSGKLLAQCDSSFYYFKRAIIERLSDDLDLGLNIKTPKKTIKLEFSDYQRFSYAISDAKSTLGFACIRNEVCNNFFDSLCIKKSMNTGTYFFERALFENFMASSDYKICDTANYLHTLAKVIEIPIEGWSKLERFYFRFINNNDLNTFYNGKNVCLVIPVYIFIDKKIMETYYFTVKVNGMKKENIRIEKKQIVINK